MSKFFLIYIIDHGNSYLETIENPFEFFETLILTEKFPELKLFKILVPSSKDTEMTGILAW